MSISTSSRSQSKPGEVESTPPALTPAPDTRTRKTRKPRKPVRPAKPYPEFPLFPHATKRWAKKIRGKTHYFGPWNDPQAALQKYLDQKDELHAGLTPRPKQEGYALGNLIVDFLESRQDRLEGGRLGARSFADYYRTCERLAGAIGKGRLVSDLGPDDFRKLRAALGKTLGPVALANEIRRAHVVFNFGMKNGLITGRVVFGDDFAPPSKREQREARNAKGARAFTAEEIRRMLATAGPQLKAMILLGINAALGNTDVAALPDTALDLAGGWLDYPRPKTAIQRRIKLWPETVAALEAVLAKRGKPLDRAHEKLVFLTKYRHPWVTVSVATAGEADQANGKALNVKTDDAISKEMRKLLNSLGINGHRNFYALRHSFQTIGAGSLDTKAVDAIMGHVDSTMGGNYTDHVPDERLQRVAEHVRGWLFGVQ